MNAYPQVVALLCLASSLGFAHGQSSSMVDGAQKLSIPELKRVYLACDVASSADRLGAHEAMWCSIIHEELKKRAFGGDFDQMLTWWREQHGAARSRTEASANP